MTTLKPAARDKLRTVSTPTVATALFKRGFRNQAIQNVHPLSPVQPVLIGPAFTLRYIPAREDLNPMTVFRNPDHPQRVAIEATGGFETIVAAGLAGAAFRWWWSTRRRCGLSPTRSASAPRPIRSMPW